MTYSSAFLFKLLNVIVLIKDRFCNVEVAQNFAFKPFFVGSNISRTLKLLVSRRLSERNCIEIVNKLISQKQLDVVHTLDGKEYITPAQISKEMKEELHVRGGK